jgi:uncharacterized protein (UPF0335 family)
MGSDVGGNAAQEQLRLFAERIEKLIEDRKAINDDIKDVKAEAKATGYDAATLMEVIRIRAQRAKSLPRYQEKKALLETYLAAFGIDDEE